MSSLVMVVATKTTKAERGVERWEMAACSFSSRPSGPIPFLCPLACRLPPAAPLGETGVLGWENWVCLCLCSLDLPLSQLPASGRCITTHLVVQARNRSRYDSCLSITSSHQPISLTSQLHLWTLPKPMGSLSLLPRPHEGCRPIPAASMPSREVISKTSRVVKLPSFF